MKWVTRERPKVDRIACPWLIARFIDKDPEFLFVPAPRVQAVANETGAAPYDVPDVELTHIGEFCSFDAFLKRYELADPALARLAVIVRGADTGRLDIAPEAAGLLAVSIGPCFSGSLTNGVLIFPNVAEFQFCYIIIGRTRTFSAPP